MSAADEAWQEWARHWPYESTWPGETPPAHSTASRESFMAGAEWALEDAADAWYDGDTDNETIVSEWLRDRAAAVAPRETKD